MPLASMITPGIWIWAVFSMVVGLNILLALLAMHLYWKHQNCFFIGIAKNQTSIVVAWIWNFRWVNIEATELNYVVPFQERNRLQFSFKSYFHLQCPILVELVSITTIRCVYFVSYNLNTISITFLEPLKYVHLAFLVIIDW